MRWLLDEMLPAATAEQLNLRGHDATSVLEVDLAGAPDADVFDHAVSEHRMIVTENFADYSVILSQRLADDKPAVPVVFVHKPDLPAGRALAAHLAERLHSWAAANPDPYLGPHWP